MRPGDLLADRYLLVDLLSESGNGRFWRAHDNILDRHVAVHVVAADDERAEGMTAAARSSATVHDRRVLRVLDVDERDGIAYVVNEWGSGTSLDKLLAAEGPVGARRAAWIVGEVAQSLAAAHDAGVAHGRLVPENVLIDESGSIRVIGLSVDAALLGLPPGRLFSDVTDLAALLYALLTGRWAGVSRSSVPGAPHEGGKVLRPRQVKAGVPRDLDALCDRVINGPAPEPPTARAIADELAAFVGDPTGMAAAEVAARNGTLRAETRSMPRIAATTPTADPRPDPEPDPTPEPEPDPTPEPEPEPPPPSTDLPTQAGMPIFDDATDDVEWFHARSERPAPPPPFEEPPARPLFAPEPSDGQPARRSRAPQPPASPTEYWPWDTGSVNSTSGVLPPVDDEDEDDGVPGRSWLRLAMIVGLCVLLLVAIVFAFNLGRGRSPLGEDPSAEDPSTSDSTPRTTTSPLDVVEVSDFDPQASPPEENSDLAPLAADGDPATAWRTVTYTDQLGPAGLKTGVGLVLDLGESQEVAQVDLTLVGAPTGIRIFVEDTVPAGVRGLTAAAETEGRDGRQRISLDEPATGRYVVVWLTVLPAAEGGGFRGEVAEAVVRG